MTRWHAAVAAGRCYRCGEPAERGLCAAHRERGRAAVRSMAARRRAAGQCPTCGEPSAGTCEVCRAKRKASDRRERHR